MTSVACETRSGVDMKLNSPCLSMSGIGALGQGQWPLGWIRQSKTNVRLRPSMTALYISDLKYV
jgi:hypothetical protein